MEKDANRSRHHRDSLLSAEATAEYPPGVQLALAANGHIKVEGVETDDENPKGPPFSKARTHQNPCLGRFCGKGRQCEKESNGDVVCTCQRHCHRHRKPVCGTDGILYMNHCELHRAACLKGKPIAIDKAAHPPFDCTEPPSTTTVSPEIDAYPSSIPPGWPYATFHMNKVKERLMASPVEPPATSSLHNYTWPSVSAFHSSAGKLKGNHKNKKDSCSIQEYEIMKDNLLLYNHAKLMAQDNRSSGKEYLVSIMFSHYDQNNDGALEKEELVKISQREHLNQLAKGCDLGDMLSYDDTDKDGHLNINEFYMAFSKLYSVSVVSLDKALEVNHLSARVGDNVEIKCDVTGTPPPPIVWRRHGADLSTLVESSPSSPSGDGGSDIRVFSDGSLYLTHIQLIHAGNYTCHAQRNKDVVQTHVLTVHTIPEVKVTPKIQSRKPGEEASMFCHVVGEPFPKVEWLKNDEPLKVDVPNKYEIVGNGTELRVHNIAYADTGAYMCQATNIGGMTRDISSLVVQEDPTPSKNLISCTLC
ncbi:hypothetical protein J437_LFUL015640 [Ladona fulva]|uniref:Follistatin-related protein 5 n=1 Tax=Ladona fulva TaxID=123851 RepID=A0A8K0KIW3_LADFU|nr:hypothetical protein J437_LFUL015640 [Ladona fulva]